MFSAYKSWRRRRILATHALPDDLWNEAVAMLPFLERYDETTLIELRDRAVLVLKDKSIVGQRILHRTGGAHRSGAERHDQPGLGV